MRRKLKKSTSRKIFRNGRKLARKNVKTRPVRGGYRL